MGRMFEIEQDGKTFEIDVPDGADPADAIKRFSASLQRPQAGSAPPAPAAPAQMSDDEYKAGMAELSRLSRPQAPMGQFERGTRRFFDRAYMGFADEYAAANRAPRTGLSYRDQLQEERDRNAIANKQRDTFSLGGVLDLAADTLGYTAGAVMTAPAAVMNTGAQVARNAMMPLYEGARAAALPIAQRIGLAPAAGTVVPQTTTQVIKEGARIGAPFGAVEGLGQSTMTGFDGAQDVAVNALGGAVGGAAIGGGLALGGKAIGAARDLPGMVNDFARERFAAGRGAAQERLRDFAQAGVKPFNPALTDNAGVNIATNRTMANVAGEGTRREAAGTIGDIENRVREIVASTGGNREQLEMGRDVQGNLRRQLLETTPDSNPRNMTAEQLQDTTTLRPGNERNKPYNPEAPQVPPVGREEVAGRIPGNERLINDAANAVPPVRPRDVPGPSPYPKGDTEPAAIDLTGPAGKRYAAMAAEREKLTADIDPQGNLVSRLESLGELVPKHPAANDQRFAPHWDSMARMSKDSNIRRPEGAPQPTNRELWSGGSRSPTDPEHIKTFRALETLARIHFGGDLERAHTFALGVQTYNRDASRYQAAVARLKAIDGGDFAAAQREVTLESERAREAMRAAREAEFRRTEETRYRQQQTEAQREADLATANARAAAREEARGTVGQLRERRIAEEMTTEQTRRQAESDTQHRDMVQERLQRPEDNVSGNDRSATYPDEFGRAYEQLRRNTENVQNNPLRDGMTATSRFLDDVGLSARSAGRAPGYKVLGQFGDDGKVNPNILKEVERRGGPLAREIIETLSSKRAAGGFQPSMMGSERLERMGGIIGMRRDLGKLIGEINDGRYTGGGQEPDVRFLTGLYKAMRADEAAVIRATSGERTQGQWARVDGQFEDFAKSVRKPLSKLLNAEEPAAVVQELARAAQEASNNPTLLNAYFKVAREKGSLPQATGVIISNMARGGLDDFVRTYGGLSPEARRLMFQGQNTEMGRQLDRLHGLARRMQKYQARAGQSATSPAQLMSPDNIMTGIMAVVYTPVAIANVAGGAVMSKVLNSHRFRAWLTEAPRAGVSHKEWAKHAAKLGGWLGGFGLNESDRAEIVKSIGEMVGARPANAMFIGPKAKGYDKAAAAKAADMEKAGKSRDEIYEATGLHKDGGVWWQEIDDREADLPARGNGKRYIGPLGKGFKHDKLYEAYPQARNWQMQRYPDDNQDHRGMQWSTKQQRYIRVLDDDLETALHETQHGIDDEEGVRYDGSENVKSRFYNESASERRATVVEERRKMTPAQRRATPPWKRQRED